MNFSHIKHYIARQKFLLSVLLHQNVKRQRLKLLKSNPVLQRVARMTSKTIKLPVQSGTLIGRTESLPEHGQYHIFQGIPYAQPPIGRLRFQPAEPYQIKGELDCTREGEISYQPDTLTKIPIGGEDCLYLNVYTPEVRPHNMLPVMLFVHGGAFMFESGGTDWRSPEYLVQEGVIVVTFNYRLSLFGFLHLPRGGIHGNQGLKDQRLAFKWVKENIEQFGGNSNNVTVFGHSAGAAAIHMHLLLPESRQYFHKAILQSGAATMDWYIQHRPEEKTRTLAKLCGCNSVNDQEIADFLRNVAPLKMLMNLMNLLTPAEKRRGLPIILKPVIEEPGPDAILTEDIAEMLRKPNQIDIPVIMGVTQKDGMIMVYGQRNRLELWDKESGRFIPRTVNIDGDNEETCRPLGEKIKHFYLGDDSVTKDPYTNFLDFMCDYNFNIPIQSAAEFHSRYQHPNSSLYYFQFSYDGELNMMKKLFELNYPGANHGDDMTYLFVMKSAELKVQPTSEAARMRKQMCRWWTNFAKYSDPTPDPSEGKWNPVKRHKDKEEFELDCFDINATSQMIKNPGHKRMQFWKEIFREHNGGWLKPKL